MNIECIRVLKSIVSLKVQSIGNAQYGHLSEVGVMPASQLHYLLNWLPAASELRKNWVPRCTPERLPTVQSP